MILSPVAFVIAPLAEYASLTYPQYHNPPVSDNSPPQTPSLFDHGIVFLPDSMLSTAPFNGAALIPGVFQNRFMRPSSIVAYRTEDCVPPLFRVKIKKHEKAAGEKEKTETYLLAVSPVSQWTPSTQNHHPIYRI
ncbi:hypothetical protein K504DRAFT_503300 [Pleomassaria siparia CBS 279.74]|uniref:Uncharacterized protein n=1 Tax=Pleomassaria siparia CBS 279.74 TaxID=1314801 RepID=A0A6G1K6M5_9PLEO|nr:hypothetical protein K504DRAFT_503300 [Pleomassaria siparia CBS 279.74]